MTIGKWTDRKTENFFNSHKRAAALAWSVKFAVRSSEKNYIWVDCSTFSHSKLLSLSLPPRVSHSRGAKQLKFFIDSQKNSLVYSLLHSLPPPARPCVHCGRVHSQITNIWATLKWNKNYIWVHTSSCSCHGIRVEWEIWAQTLVWNDAREQL